MITTLAVSGYRSLRDVVLELGQLTVVTGANGSGKSNLYRALRLLAASGSGDVINAIAREGGFPSVLWAGPETPDGSRAPQGTIRRGPIAVQLGFASEELGYLIDLGLPQAGGPFDRDPEIKRELVFAGPVARPAALLIDRLRERVRVREDTWRTIDSRLASDQSMLLDLADGDTVQELHALRRRLTSWRFYDGFRVDQDAPARQIAVGSRSHTLAHGGENLAAVWTTIDDAGRGGPLDDAVAAAFDGARVDIQIDDGRFRLTFRQPGLLRPLDASELSDGTLRYLLLCAALLPARPAPLIVLNEPEASLHPSLLPALADLIREAARHTQVLLVSHAEALTSALPDAVTHRLTIDPTGTSVAGRGPLDAPLWAWGSR